MKPRRFTVERRDGTVLASRMSDAGVLVVRDNRTGAEVVS